MAVRRPEPADRALLDQLDHGPVDAAPDSDTARRLAPLLTAGVVIEIHESEPLEPARAERFARQLPYFAERGDAAATQRRLGAATITIIGCGGLGTWTLGALAGLGIGTFVLVDDDVVESSNLNRQILFGVADLGARKVDCASRWIHALDPQIEVQQIASRIASESDARAVVAHADAVVLAADWPPYELGRWVNRACVTAGVPFIVAGLQPPVLKVGPTYAPGRGPCFACHETQLETQFPLYRDMAAYRREHPAAATTIGAAAGTVGTLVALEVMHLLTQDEPVATQGRAWLLDMRTLDQRWERIQRDPACPVCAER